MKRSLVFCLSFAVALAGAAVCLGTSTLLGQSAPTVPVPKVATPTAPKPAAKVAAKAPGKSGPRPAVKTGPPRIIPRTYAINAVWVNTSRDPFLSPGKRGPDALIANRPAPAPASKPLGYDTRKFVDDLKSAGDGNTFKVEGVMPGFGGNPTVIVVNGHTYGEGEFMPVRVHTEDYESFQAIAKRAGLEFEKVASRTLPPRFSTPVPGQPGSKAPASVQTDVLLLLQVGRIREPNAFGPGGVELKVPGYTTDALVVLPLKFPPHLQADPSLANQRTRR